MTLVDILPSVSLELISKILCIKKYTEEYYVENNNDCTLLYILLLYKY